MDASALHQLLSERFAGRVGALEHGMEPAIRLTDPSAIVEVCSFLRTSSELAFDCLTNQSGIDYPARNEIEIVYHLFSYSLRHTAVVKVGLPRDNPSIASVSGVWSTAIWQEREIFDLLGVFFDSHPDLRRILLPEDWVGHPLRKDYVEPTEYHGISTKRESML